MKECSLNTSKLINNMTNNFATDFYTRFWLASITQVPKQSRILVLPNSMTLQT